MRLTHQVRKCSSAMTSSYVTLEETVDVPWLEESLDSVKIMCKKIVPGWAAVPLDHLTVARMSGGITNILFSVTPAPCEARDPVIVRIFGPMTDKVIDRKRELAAMQALSDGGFGAHLIGRFGNGVVQAFIKAHTLSTEEMASPELIPLIAATLRRFHAVKVPGSHEPQLWPTVQHYLQLARGLQFEDRKQQEQYSRIDLDALDSEVRQVQNATDSLSSPVVFSHNDLLAGNIMRDNATGALHLIDFEYSAYGFRGYDIANHFCEYAGFDCDYSRFPNREMQMLFFRHYMDPAHPDTVEEAELERLGTEVRVFTLASHLYWAVWSLIQARYSPIDFDFMAYFHLRYAAFKKAREAAKVLLT